MTHTRGVNLTRGRVDGVSERPRSESIWRRMMGVRHSAQIVPLHAIDATLHPTDGRFAHRQMGPDVPPIPYPNGRASAAASRKKLLAFFWKLKHSMWEPRHRPHGPPPNIRCTSGLFTIPRCRRKPVHTATRRSPFTSETR